MPIPKAIPGFYLKKALLTFIMAVGLITNAYSQAQQKIDSLKNVIKNAPEDTTLVINLSSLGSLHSDIRNFDMAVKYGDSALALANKIEFRRGMALAHLGIGKALLYKGSYMDAIEHNIKAKNLCEENRDKKTMAKALFNNGMCWWALDNYDEALESTLAGLTIFKEIGDQFSIIKSYSNIGRIYASKGNLSDALKYQMDYLKIAEETGNNPEIIIAYIDIANIYFQLGDKEEAKRNYMASLKIAEKSGDKLSMAVLYNNLGGVENNQEKALVYFQNALRIQVEFGNKSSMAKCHNNIGGIHMDLGNYQEAKKHFLEALTLNEETGSQAAVSGSYGQLGKLSMFLGEYQSARMYLEKGLSIAQLVGNISNLSFIYRNIYLLDSAEGDFKQSLESYKLHNLYLDSLRGEESTNKISQLKLQYETEKKDQEIELLNKDNEIKSLQLSKQKAIRHGMIAGIILLFLAGFFLFRSFRLRKKLEQQQAIISERRRISADLHDDVGSGLSRIMLLTELVKNEARTPEMKQEAEKIAGISKELSANISEIIWALNANNDTLESLVAYIRRYAAEFFEDAAVKLKISTHGGIAEIPLSGEKRRDIFYTVKEALHNIMKHSGASEAELSFTLNEGELAVEIRDNGRGIPEEPSKVHGNGLNNMRQRMEAVRGSFSIENHEGTKITMKVPVL